MRIATFLMLAVAAFGEEPIAAHFHHVHFNSTDPAAAVQFYTARLESEKRRFDGRDAVWANNVWLLFNRVAKAPKAEITSGIWHVGWGGGTNMRETYQKQLDGGTKFFTPLTDLSDQCDGKGGNGRFLFAYIDGPDHALTELNTTEAGNYRFGHIHLLSDDPVAAGEWYQQMFGLTRRGSGPVSREPRYRCGRQTGPAVSLMIDAVNLIIYPIGNSKDAFPEVWKGRAGIESSEGHAIDHFGLAVPDLDAALKRLRGAGVRVVTEPARMGEGLRSAMVEGPDKVRIELVEQR
jgi:predicted enzyme related to lactoylglutathione lyase